MKPGYITELLTPRKLSEYTYMAQVNFLPTLAIALCCSSIILNGIFNMLFCCRQSDYTLEKIVKKIQYLSIGFVYQINAERLADVSTTFHVRL